MVERELILNAFVQWVMWNGDSWWYQTKHYWVDFPNHWYAEPTLAQGASADARTTRRRMSAPLKYYYLLQVRQEPFLQPFTNAYVPHSVHTGFSR